MNDINLFRKKMYAVKTTMEMEMMLQRHSKQDESMIYMLLGTLERIENSVNETNIDKIDALITMLKNAVETPESINNLWDNPEIRSGLEKQHITKGNLALVVKFLKMKPEIIHMVKKIIEAYETTN